MIKRFHALYVGQIDLDNVGLDGTPADQRRYSISHFTVDEALDGEVIRALREKDAEALQTLPREQLTSGSSEIRNWICAAGALEHLDLSWVQYCPGYRTLAGTGTGLCFASWA